MKRELSKTLPNIEADFWHNWWSLNLNLANLNRPQLQPSTAYSPNLNWVKRDYFQEWIIVEKTCDEVGANDLGAKRRLIRWNMWTITDFLEHRQSVFWSAIWFLNLWFRRSNKWNSQSSKKYLFIYIYMYMYRIRLS